VRSFFSFLGVFAEGAVTLATYTWLAACVVAVAVAVAAVLAAIFGGWLGALVAVAFGGMVVVFVRVVLHSLHDDATI